MGITEKLVGTTARATVLFALAAALVAGGAAGATAAAPAYVSDDYRAEVEVPALGTALVENGADAGGSLLAWIAEEDGNVKPGKKYAEQLAVRNTEASTDEYVRVIVRKYWADKDGNKLRDKDTGLIGLEFDTTGGWSVDEASTTDERTILYYAPVLAAGATSSPFTKSLTISKDLPLMVTQTTEEVDGGTVITTTYTYDDGLFVVEAEVDAVQTHSPVSAILSAWGVDVTLSGTDISLAG